MGLRRHVIYDATQGQGLAPVSETGNADGIHLHFHVAAGSESFEPYDTVPFAMSDGADFNGQGVNVTNGPSDNAPVAYEAGGTLDATIRNMYLAQGGASGSWWNVGAAYRSTNEANDEWGGVCRNTLTAFVHLCGTTFGNGILAAQNFIDSQGVRRTVYRSSTEAGVVKGQIQGTLSNNYLGGALSRIMGAPIGPEVNGVQPFQGGELVRYPAPGIRVDVVVGQFIFRVGRYDARGVFCPSVNADQVVSSIDLSQISQRFGTSNPFYDINMDGTVSSIDLSLTASRFSSVPCPTVIP